MSMSDEHANISVGGGASGDRPTGGESSGGQALPSRTVYEDRALGVRVTYHPGYLAPAVADELLAWLTAHATWQREAPVVFGQAREVRRRTCAFGERGRTYRYAGVQRAALPWPEPLELVAHRLVGHFGFPFNFGLCTLYPDGDAGIGKHADDVRDLARSAPIIGLSLGAARDFVLYKGDRLRVAAVALEHGSIVVMWDQTQQHLKHALPPRRHVQEPRINVTFRVIVPRSISQSRR